MYPIIYKVIPTQYAFYVSEDGTVQIQAVTKIPTVKKCKDTTEAREFINNYIEQL